jgi:cellulose synthase/poly-beta-1,6-N-acetylglucosamine synthase-like glycosyltransferase
MTSFITATLFLYFLVLLILAIFGVHRYAMVYLYTRYRDRKALCRSLPAGKEPPRVTVQLPLYNEMYVADRLISSVASIRYPKERLEIQVLDDSTDETTAIAEAAVLRARALGLDITLIHRDDRQGFKAGALENGLKTAKGEFILIFDADFIAPPDILEKSLGHFEDEAVGLVQARWGHVNRDCSLLTEFQSIMLDGHFIMEHGGRNRGGRFFNFNGTAGIWRKSAIVESGGWQHDTLTEDLDLSYRAQMKGFRFVFIEDLVCPAELPVDVNAFRSQQARWAKGSTQVCVKLLPRLLSSTLPLRIKAEAAFHLTANFAYPLMVALSLLMFPAMVIRYDMGWMEMLLIDVPLFMGATTSVCSFYAFAQRQAFGEPSWRARLKYIPGVLALGIGLSVNNARAVIEGLVGKPSEFVRTPKLGVLVSGDEWRKKRYRGHANWVPYFELSLAFYLAAMAVYALTHGQWGTAPFVLIFLAGYLYIALLSLIQGIGRPRVAPALQA